MHGCMHACMHNTDALIRKELVRSISLAEFRKGFLSAMIGFAVLLASFTVFGAGLRCFYKLLTVFSRAGALF